MAHTTKEETAQAKSGVNKNSTIGLSMDTKEYNHVKAMHTLRISAILSHMIYTTMAQRILDAIDALRKASIYETMSLCNTARQKVMLVKNVSSEAIITEAGNKDKLIHALGRELAERNIDWAFVVANSVAQGKKAHRKELQAELAAFQPVFDRVLLQESGIDENAALERLMAECDSDWDFIQP